MNTACQRVVTVLLGAFLFSCVQAAEPGFERQTIDGNIQIGYGLAVGRVDGDRHVDLLLADKSAIVWYENPGSAGKEWTKHVMARDLTARDNVCVAARDIDGDGLVEVAVGANWNPGETSDSATSGTMFYLQRPADPQKPWKPIPIAPHEPTTHRMRWVNSDDGMRLAVLPLHGVGNKSGAGKNVFVSLYAVSNGTPKLVNKVDTLMHMTHNFDLLADPTLGDNEFLLIAGKEGYSVVDSRGRARQSVDPSLSKGAGEVRAYQVKDRLFASIEPMHGTDVVFYRQQGPGEWTKEVIDTSLNQGHALATGNLFGSDAPEIVVGWRGLDANQKVGIKVYTPHGTVWQKHTIDDNQMACEDLKLFDFDSDGKLDIVAAGRATTNVVIYWNRS